MNRLTQVVSLRCLPVFLIVLACASAVGQHFHNPVRIPTQEAPAAVYSADLNKDGRPDFVYAGVTSPAGTTLHSLLARVDGTYTETAAITVPGSGKCLLVDVNADRQEDLVCGNNPSDTSVPPSIAVALGRGDGTFAAPLQSVINGGNRTFYTTVFYPEAIGDFNQDGKLDLVLGTISPGSIAILAGSGAGAFQTLSVLNDTGPVVSLSAVDLNGDGNLDLVTTGYYATSLEVMLGRGNGVLSSPVLYRALSSAVLADADQDGHLDLVGSDQGTLSILHGNMDGTFSTTPIAQAIFPGSGLSNEPSLAVVLAYTDLNGDGIPDVLAGGNDGLTTILGDKGFKFSVAGHVPAAQQFALADHNVIRSGLPLDVNGDGRLDFVAAGPDALYVTYGNGDGTFQSADTYESGAKVLSHTVADFDGDGHPDVVTGGDTLLYLSRGKADGTFLPATSLAGTAVEQSQYSSQVSPILVHGDFDGDGRQDLIATGNNGTVAPQPYLFRGKGDGTFAAALLAPLRAAALAQRDIGDLNGDGKDDFISSDGENSAYQFTLSSLLSNGDGTFRTVATGITSSSPVTYTLVDFNGDGKLDLVTASDTAIGVSYGKGDGTFVASGIQLSIPEDNPSSLSTSSQIVTGDLDGDGNRDIVVLTSELLGPRHKLIVFYGNGASTFSPSVPLSLAYAGYSSLIAADLNGDGRDDLFYQKGGTATTYGSGPGALFSGGGSGVAITVRQGRSDRTLANPVDFFAHSTTGVLLQPVDLNADKLPDLITISNDTYTANIFNVLLNEAASPLVFGSIAEASGTLTVAPEPSQVDQPLIITAHLSPPAGISLNLTGLVTFSINGSVVGTSSLLGNVAQISVPSALAIGSYNVAATWPGKGGSTPFNPLVLTTSHAVQGLPTTSALTVTPLSVTVGDTVQASYSVTNNATSDTKPTLGGSLTLTGGGAAVMATAAPLFQSGVTIVTPVLLRTGGGHSLVATYSGDERHAASASASVVVPVKAIDTHITLSTSTATVLAGHPVQFSVRLSANTASVVESLFQTGTVTLTGLPSGPITVSIAAAGSGSGVSLAGGTYVSSTLQPGTYSMVAHFSGNDSALASDSPVLSQAILVVPTITLAPTQNPVYQGQGIQVIAKVAGFGTPGGSLTLRDGTQVFATAALVAGNATFDGSQLTAGTHTLTAHYGGDSANAAADSLALAQVVLAPDFSVSLDPATLSVRAGGSTTATVTASALGSFADTLRVESSNLPPNATVSIATQSLPLSSAGPARIMVTVATGTAQASLQAPKRSRWKDGAPALAFLLFVPFVGLARYRSRTILSVLVVGAALVSMSGCGSSPQSTAPGGTQSTPAGNYMVTLLVRGETTQKAHTVSVPLQVTN